MSENEDRDIDYSNGENESYIEAQNILGDTDDEHQSVKFTNYLKELEPKTCICNDCTRQSDFVVQTFTKGQPSFTCMKCLFNKIIDTGTKQFYDDSREYKGMFFSYEDSFNTKS